MGKVTITLEVDADALGRAADMLAAQGRTVEEELVQFLEAAGGEDASTSPGHERWVMEQLAEAMQDTSPGIPQDQVRLMFARPPRQSVAGR